MGRITTILTVTALTALTVAVGYAAYFDYKRRNDAAFRKQLRKEQKRAHRTAVKVAESAGGPSKDELREALQKVKDEKVPESAEAKEQYFMQNVSVGEQLCAQGEASYLPAALSFYRALRVYPSPVELIIIYQKTVPEPVFKIVMEMTSLDVSAPLSTSSTAAGGLAAALDEEGGGMSPISTGRTGPPSETSSQEWEKLTDPGIVRPS